MHPHLTAIQSTIAPGAMGKDVFKLIIQPVVSWLMGLHLSTVFKPRQNHPERRDCKLQQGTCKLPC